VGRHKSWIAVIAIAVTVAALAAVALPQKAEAAGLKARLNFAKRTLRKQTHRLTVAQAALAAALAAAAAEPGLAAIDPTVTDAGVVDPGVTDPAAAPSPTATPSPTAAPSPTATPSPAGTSVATPATPTVEELRARVARTRHAVRTWKLRVRRLARQYRFRIRMAEWERRGQWMPIIRVAAAKYHVNADGIYRMMMRESGGRRYAGSNSAFKGLFQYWPGTWSASWNPWRHDSIYDGSSQIFATAYAISKGMGRQMWTTTFVSQY
jgi:soluble lytic murein transglycosylase-like protein